MINALWEEGSVGTHLIQVFMTYVSHSFLSYDDDRECDLVKITSFSESHLTNNVIDGTNTAYFTKR